VFCSGYEQLEDHPVYEAWPRVPKPVDIEALDGAPARPPDARGAKEPGARRSSAAH